MLAVRGLGAEALLARHQERIEVYENDRGVRARSATIEDITAVEDALSWAFLRKQGASGYGLIFLFLPALFLPFTLGRGHVPSSVAALAICSMAGFYALAHWAIRGPLLRYNARRAHTEDITVGTDSESQPDDVSEDGTILATGPTERRLRVLAVAGAVLACAWPIAFGRKLPAVIRHAGGGALLMWWIFPALAIVQAVAFIRRAKGKVWAKRGSRDPARVWSGLLFMNVIFAAWLDWHKGAFHRALYVVAGLSILLAIAGARLEKKRGQ